MIIWLVIILVLGGSLAFFAPFLTEYNLVWCIGVVIMLISAGIGLRISFFSRKGEKEKYMEEIRELKNKLAEKENDEKNTKE